MDTARRATLAVALGKIEEAVADLEQVRADLEHVLYLEQEDFDHLADTMPESYMTSDRVAAAETLTGGIEYAIMAITDLVDGGATGRLEDILDSTR